jgi:ABC-type transport system involved in multi-copper enzyme maturation permease subunit
MIIIKLTSFWLTRYLKQGRILILYLLALCLFLLSAFIYASRYEEDLTTQDQRMRDLQRAYGSVRNPDELAGSTFEINMPASPLRFLVDNNLEDIPTARDVGAHTAFLPETAGRQRTQLLVLWDIDLAFLVSVVFTFLAVVVTFDSICGEKEQGTLRLMMANSVPRYKVVLSKIIASFLALGLPLLVGMLIACLILNLAGVVAFGGDQILIAFAFFLFSLLLLLFFTTLGTLISSLTRSAITSLIILLLLWVLLVVIVPGLSKPIAKEFVKARTPEEFSKENDKLIDMMFQDYKAYGATDRPPEMARVDNFKFEKRWNIVRGNFYQRRQALVDDQVRRLYAQTETALWISRLSPNMLFNRSASAIAGTDFETVRDFLAQAALYKTVLFDFMR